MLNTMYRIVACLSEHKQTLSALLGVYFCESMLQWKASPLSLQGARTWY